METTSITVNSNHAAVDRLDGFSVQEDAGAPATVEFRKEVVGGAIVVYLNLAASETATIMFPRSLSFEGGTYVKEVTGSVSGVLYGS